jgi:hypothetical protein
MGAEVLKYYTYTSPIKRARMNLGHNRPEVQGIEIATRGGQIHTLLAIGDIKEVPAPVAAPLLASVDNEKPLSVSKPEAVQAKHTPKSHWKHSKEKP